MLSGHVPVVSSPPDDESALQSRSDEYFPPVVVAVKGKTVHRVLHMMVLKGQERAQPRL